MLDEKLIKEGLDGKDSLKIILSGYVDKSENENTEEKVGVVSVMFVSESKELVIKKIEEFEAKYPERYFMVYSVPLDTNLEELNHYPSIGVDVNHFLFHLFKFLLFISIKKATRSITFPIADTLTI